MLSSEPLKDDPGSHCVPTFEAIDAPDDNSKSHLPSPSCGPRIIDNPPLDRAKEVADCVDQLPEVHPPT